MNTLLNEILLCLAAAALFSLLIGWILRGVKTGKQLDQLDNQWKAHTSEMQLQHQQEVDALEDQVQSLGKENRSLSETGHALTESLHKNEMSVHKARADAIELNRQQAETQERLQRIIHQKDEEITSLKAHVPNVAAAAVAASATTGLSAEEQIQSLSAKREAWEKDRQQLMESVTDEQQTVVIDPVDVPSEAHDQTIRIDEEQSSNVNPDRRGEQNLDLDSTLSLDQSLDAVEQTIVVDPMREKLAGKNTPGSADTTERDDSPGGTPRNSDDSA